MRNRKRLLVIAATLFVAYLGAYLGLSRHAYAEADRLGVVGFFYVQPEDTFAWRFQNYGCVILFWPLNVADRCLGLGRHPAAEPMWGLGW